MFNNTSQSSIGGNSSCCKFTAFPDGDHNDSLLLITTVVTAILSPVAVAGNALVLAAIWRNPSLRTSTYFLLGGLAFTDFCTGLITQPLYVVLLLQNWGHSSILSNTPPPEVTFAIVAWLSLYFISITLLTITLMAIERWQHMARRSIVTPRRVCKIFVIIFLISIPLPVFNVSVSLKGTARDKDKVDITIAVVVASCLLTTSVAYFKIFRIIRCHQQQVQANESSQNIGQPAINLAKYKKSVFSILYILLLFYVTYLPIVLYTIVSRLIVNSETLSSFHYVSSILIFSSSSLNPFLYCWRMKDIRDGVRHLLKTITCETN